MNKLNMTMNIRPNLSAGDWQLFTNVPGAENAAVELNQTLAMCVNMGSSREATKIAMLTEMERLSEFGASDTEPRAVLGDILNRIYK